MLEAVEVVLEQCPSPPPLISNKLGKAVRLIVFMIQKRSRKLQTAILPDLRVMVRRGKILGKSFNDLMLRHNTALGCTSHDVRMSFVSPREYEFSCTSSPPHRRYSSSRHVPSRKDGRYYYYNKHRGRHGNRISPRSPAYDRDDDVVLPVGSFKMFKADQSPVSSSRRVVKTTAKEPASLSFRSGCSGGGDLEEGDFHVDKAAEEFIQKFYRELMMQKWNMAREAAAADRFV